MSDKTTDKTTDKTIDKNDGRFTSSDHFDNPHEKALSNLVTAKDGDGIERIVSASSETFVPAPLEASDEEKEAAKRRLAMFDKASKERQAQLEGEVKDEDRAVNNPADGGSQSTTKTVKEAEAK